MGSMQFNIAIHETKDTDFCFDFEYIKGINELDVEGKRPEMKKGMEKELIKTIDLKERAPPSQIYCLFVCLFVCLFACLLVCLFVCLLACLQTTTINVSIKNQ